MAKGPVAHDASVLTASEIRALAAWRGAPTVVSLYLDVDGRRYPRPSDYAPNLDHLFRVARETADPHGGQAGTSLEIDLVCIADWLAQGLDRSSARGVAAFSAGADGMFEAFTLPVPVRDQVVVAPTPDVAQLIAALAVTAPFLVVALDQQRSQLLRVGPGGCEEVAAPIDDVERQVDTDVELGSFEHRHEEHARQHVRRVAAAVVTELDRQPAEDLVLSGTHEILAHLESELPRRTGALLAGRINLPPGSPLADLETAARAVVEQARGDRQRAVATAVRERAEQGVGAVIGLAATLPALNAGEVETLVVDAGFASPGGHCDNCEALLDGGGPCLTCGAEVRRVANVVDEAVTRAFVHHVAVEFCPEGELGSEGIGALTRHVPQGAAGGV